MHQVWQEQIKSIRQIVHDDGGPELVTLISGTPDEQAYWRDHFEHTQSYTFRRSKDTSVVSVCEGVRKGNFLGTFNAWNETLGYLAESDLLLPDVGLFSVLFGRGKRLSPFTQALGNIKSAFPLPVKVGEKYLCVADLSNFCANVWVTHLRQSGFRGVVVNWGDQSIIPGRMWDAGKFNYHDVDAVRFVYKTNITPDLAQEKEWIIVDSSNDHMIYQISRQELSTLEMRLANLGSGDHSFGVNLGSFAVSYEFLDVAAEVLHEDIADRVLWADWDPYVWIALFCETEADWLEERTHEDKIGKIGIRELEARYPDFYRKMAALRAALENRVGRRLAVAALDFGDAFWLDMGLHVPLRETFEVLIKDTPEGFVTRDLFGIPHERDARGNIVIDSVIPDSADISNSLLIDTYVESSNCVIKNGILIGSRHETVRMPQGGVSLQSKVRHLQCAGPNSIVFRSLSDFLITPEGGRHTSLLLPQGPTSLVSLENGVDYKGDDYLQPILGNPLSFAQAASLMSTVDKQGLERAWTSWSQVQVQ